MGALGFERTVISSLSWLLSRSGQRLASSPRWACAFWAFAQDGCLLSFPVDWIGAVLYRLLCAFLPCLQLATTGRTRLGLVDFKLHQTRNQSRCPHQPAWWLLEGIGG